MSEALTNPAMVDLGFLVGEWEMRLSDASFLAGPDDELVGRLEVTAIESGMLLSMRQFTEPGGTPAASWVIGRDGTGPEYTVLYTDTRGVSRVYGMRFDGPRWAMWRDDVEFAQRFGAAVDADRGSVDGRWEKRVGSGEWEHDFAVRYVRR